MQTIFGVLCLSLALAGARSGLAAVPKNAEQDLVWNSGLVQTEVKATLNEVFDFFHKKYIFERYVTPKVENEADKISFSKMKHLVPISIPFMDNLVSDVYGMIEKSDRTVLYRVNSPRGAVYSSPGNAMSHSYYSVAVSISKSGFLNLSATSVAGMKSDNRLLIKVAQNRLSHWFEGIKERIETEFGP